MTDTETDEERQTQRNRRGDTDTEKQTERNRLRERQTQRNRRGETDTEKQTRQRNRQGETDTEKQTRGNRRGETDEEKQTRRETDTEKQTRRDRHRETDTGRQTTRAKVNLKKRTFAQLRTGLINYDTKTRNSGSVHRHHHRRPVGAAGTRDPAWYHIIWHTGISPHFCRSATPTPSIAFRH